jgi:hypothetical protein
MAIPNTFEYRVGCGYFKKSDQSGPYWIDDGGNATLLIGMVAIVGASVSPLYVYRYGAGYFKRSTGAGPYAST